MKHLGKEWFHLRGNPQCEATRQWGSFNLRCIYKPAHPGDWHYSSGVDWLAVLPKVK